MHVANGHYLVKKIITNCKAKEKAKGSHQKIPLYLGNNSWDLKMSK